MSKKLIKAIKGNNNKQAEELIKASRKNKGDLSAPDDSGKTALHWAAIKDNASMFQTLLENLPSNCIGITDHRGRAPIHIAAAKNSPEIIKSLIDSYPNEITQLNNEGSNVLHIAAAKKNWGVIDKIFSSLKDKPLEILINQRDNNGSNPLGIVLLNRNIDQNLINVIEKFLECECFKVNEYLNNKKGMDILADEEFEELLNIGGFNLLHYALKEKSIPIMNALNERQQWYRDINFFYPAQNPKFHMYSPDKILGQENKDLVIMLLEAQKAQEDREDADADGDSDIETNDAYIWKHVLLDMVNSPLHPPLPKEEAKYVVPLFHGVPFMTNLYTNADRKYVGKKMMLLNPWLENTTKNIIKEHLENIDEDEVQKIKVNSGLKAIYSRTSTASAGVANMTVIAQDDMALGTLKEKNGNLKEALKQAYSNDESNNKAVFQGVVLDFVNKFKDENGATQELVWNQITALNNNLNNGWYR